jgi:hypothetical protein
MSTAPVGPPSGPTVPQQPPHPKRNDAVLWILAIVGGGFVVLVVGGLLVASMFIHRVHVGGAGKQLEIETPAGALRVNGDQPHSTGLPLYPGAKPDESEGATVDLSADSGAGLGLAAEKYVTSDDLDQVSQWYQEKLGPSYKREEHGSATHRQHVSSDADVAYTFEKGDTTRLVALTKKSGGVEIELLRVGKKEVQ